MFSRASDGADEQLPLLQTEMGVQEAALEINKENQGGIKRKKEK